MKRIIYTLFTKLDDYENGSYFEYYDRLLKNKQDYADKIGVDFRFYDQGPADFADINNHKHTIFSKLADTYDEVMYVDFDVIFNTDENIFDQIDLSKGIAVKDQNDEVDRPYKPKTYNKRNPTLKYEISKALLNGKDVDVINTGVMIGRAEHIRLLKFNDNYSEAIDKLPTLDHPLSEDFYPNNESIFSYILVKENIPYQILDDEWHDIRDHNPSSKPFGKIIHFINKRFNAYYKDKTKCIFSLYVNIDDVNLDNPGMYPGDNINKSARTKMQMNGYYDQLLENKEKYAEIVGADFKMFGYDNQYKEFSKGFTLLSEYDVINIYKIWLIDQLAKEYDYVLYLDFDVIVNTDIDFFDYNDVDNRLCCMYSDVSEDKKVSINPNFKYDYRAPIAKYWNAHALLAEEDIDDFDNIMFNTGIVGATRKMMDQLDYFSDIDEVIEIMNELKNDEYSFYPKHLRDVFGFDNESIFMYKCIKNNVPFINLDPWWHYKIDHYYEKMKLSYIKDNGLLLHVINKKFEVYYE